jgi:metal-dependent hydrolase (beta-lactamase superfamily II)
MALRISVPSRSASFVRSKSTYLGKITDSFFIVSFGFVCRYVFRVGEMFIAFDTGMSPGKTRAKLSLLHINPLSIRHVFLTHSGFVQNKVLAA